MPKILMLTTDQMIDRRILLESGRAGGGRLGGGDPRHAGRRSGSSARCESARERFGFVGHQGESDHFGLSDVASAHVFERRGGEAAEILHLAQPD